MKTLLKGCIRLYQFTLSPMLGHSCRFEPTCSHYALQALDQHGALRGSHLSIKRLLRCQPFSNAGYDPVPESINSTSSQGKH